jgi:hypothetical protein
MEVPQNTKIKLPYDLVIVLLCIHPPKIKAYYSDTGTAMLLVALFTIAKL